MIIRIVGLFVFANLISSLAYGQGEEDVQATDYAFWSAMVVDEVANRLEESLGDKALVWETVGNYDGHSVYLVLRGKTGTAEIHETESDVQISIRGRATSLLGGELLNPEQLPRKTDSGCIDSRWA